MTGSNRRRRPPAPIATPLPQTPPEQPSLCPRASLCPRNRTDRRNRRTRAGRSATAGAGLLVAAIVLGGCSAAREQIERAQSLYASGNPEAAYQSLAVDKGLRDETRDGFLWRLEEGKMAHDAGRYDEAWATLNDATLLADRIDLEWSKTSVGEEFGAVAVNDRLRVFRGSYADRIALENARVLAALARADGLGAATAAKRIAERQKEAEVDQAKRIEAINKEIGKRGGTKAVNELLGREGVDLGKGYAAYLNPLGSWLSGILQCSTGDGNDRQRGETELRRALSMMPENRTLLAQTERNPFDLAKAGERQVIVLFELGMAPKLEQETVHLITPWLGLSTIPFPRQERMPRPAQAIEARGGGAVVRTETLADYDAIWERDFQQRLPEIIFRTVVMVAAKEAATFAATEPLRQKRRGGSDGAAIGEIAVLIGASIYKAATNQSDLRTWRSIPAEVQIAQLPRPADNAIDLALVNGGVGFGATKVNLPDAPVSLVWVRAAVPGQLIVRACPLQATYDVPTPPEPVGGAEPAPSAPTGQPETPPQAASPTPTTPTPTTSGAS
jgi:hypothetical protein